MQPERTSRVCCEIVIASDPLRKIHAGKRFAVRFAVSQLVEIEVLALGCDKSVRIYRFDEIAHASSVTAENYKKKHLQFH